MKADSPKDIAKIFRDGTLIDAALAKAAAESKETHKRLGIPAAACRDGKVVWIPAEELEAPLDESMPGGSGESKAT